jgi:hypothetical protein
VALVKETLGKRDALISGNGLRASSLEDLGPDEVRHAMKL